jgi:hypothetical protein
LKVFSFQEKSDPKQIRKFWDFNERRSAQILANPTSRLLDHFPSHLTDGCPKRQFSLFRHSPSPLFQSLSVWR